MASERAAFLLGWVRLALAPPPTGAESAQQEEGRPHHAAGGRRSVGNDNGSNEGGTGFDEGSASTGQEAATRRTEKDTQAGRINPGNGENGEPGRRTRRGPLTNAPGAVTPLSGARGDRTEGGGGGTATGASEVLPAGPGHVWFHVPSARLVEELPTNWVAFSGVSGGILADVSRVSRHAWGRSPVAGRSFKYDEEVHARKGKSERCMMSHV